jgi:sterol 3beta-glucosyltransferase
MDFAVLATFNTFLEKHGVPRAKCVRELRESKLLNLVGVTPQLAPSPTGWEPHNKICGFFKRSARDREESLPIDLERFLESGERPVFMGFGSMVSDGVNVDETTSLMLDAARRIDHRVVLQAPWTAEQASFKDERTFILDRVPHHLLFPRCSLIVHHGGSGTTHASLEAGRPSVIVAHAGDQPLFGKLLQRAGASRYLLSRRSLTPRKLARAISKSLNAPSLAQRADAIGQEMKAEDGVGVAVRHLEELGHQSGLS